MKNTRKKNIWKKKCKAAAGLLQKGSLALLLLLFGIGICLPVFLLLSGSITDAYEMKERLAPILGLKEGMISWKWVPDYPDFQYYGKLLFGSPEFFVLFWNSMRMSVGILAGQLLAAVPAAWSFAVYPDRKKKILFSLYLVLMLLPFQVTMLSSYLVLDGLQLMNTQWAVVLPAVFSAFPVFLIYQGFASIPVSLLEAARIDGAGECWLLWRIGIPLASGSILSALVFGYLEYWNLIEQPLTYLKDQSLWPLSLYLPEIGLEQASYAMAASVLTLIPAGLVFGLGQDYLEQGIAAAGLKE